MMVATSLLANLVSNLATLLEYACGSAAAAEQFVLEAIAKRIVKAASGTRRRGLLASSVSSSSAAALAAASGSDPPTIDLGSAAAVSELADDSVSVAVEVGRCRLTLSNPRRKRREPSLNLQYDEPPSNFAFTFKLRRYVEGGGIRNATEVSVSSRTAVAGVASNSARLLQTQAAAVAQQTDEEFAASDPKKVIEQSAAVTVVMQGSALREAGAYTRPRLTST